MYLKRKEALSFAVKRTFLLQKKEYSVSGPVLNRCHREGREGYGRASSAWTFSEGDCNLTRPEENGDDIDKGIPDICHFFTRAKFLENKIYTEKRQFCALNL